MYRPLLCYLIGKYLIARALKMIQPLVEDVAEKHLKWKENCLRRAAGTPSVSVVSSVPNLSRLEIMFMKQAIMKSTASPASRKVSLKMKHP